MNQPFLERVARDVYQKYGKELSQIAVIFPNKRPMTYFKKYLGQLIDVPVFNAALYTIQDFLASSHKLVVAHDIHRVFLLWQCYNEIQHKYDEEPEGIDHFLPTAEMIIADFDQIDSYMIQPNKIYSVLEGESEIAVQFGMLEQEQIDILQQFWRNISLDSQAETQQRFLYLWKILPELYNLYREKLTETGLITTAQIGRRLAENPEESSILSAKNTKIVLVGFNALSTSERILFKRWQDEGKGVCYFDVDAYYMENNIQEAGFFMRQNFNKFGLINALGTPTHRLNDPSKKVVVMAAEGQISQAKALHSLLRHKHGDEMDSPTKRAVILADENLLIPALQSIPEGIKLNVTMGFQLKESALYGYLILWLESKRRSSLWNFEKITLEDLHSWMVHPLNTTINTQAKVLYGNLIKSDFVDLADIKDLGGELSLFFAPVENGIALLDQLADLIQMVTDRRQTEGVLHQIDSDLLVNCYQAVNRLADCILSFNENLPLHLVMNFLKKNLDRVIAGLEGEPLHGLQVMGLMESRNLDFEEVIIVAANEGILPSSGFGKTLLPEGIRKAFGLPVVEQRDALSAYTFTRLFHFAQQITIVYNSLVDNYSTGEVSRFVQQLQFESQINFTQLQYQKNVSGNLKTPTPLKILKTPAVIKKIIDYLTNTKRGVSPSAIKKYLQCPLAFFFEYIAGFKEDPQIEDPTESLMIGNIVHEVMEQFYTKEIQLGSLVTKELIHSKIDNLDNLVNDALIKIYYKNKPMSSENFNGADKMATTIVAEIVRKFLKHDGDHVVPFTIREVESKKNELLRVPYLEDELEVLLVSKVDRIDEKDNEKRVVDYKTGKASVEYSTVEDLFNKEQKVIPEAFQLLFYTMLCREGENEPVYPTPHVYAARSMDNPSTNLKKKAQTESWSVTEEMTTYETLLTDIILEILDPAIPFAHNPHSTHYSSSPFVHFCQLSSSEDDVEY